MEFVAFVGEDKENWGQVTALINRLDDCEKVVLVMNKKVSGFPTNKKCDSVEVDCTNSLIELKQEIMDKVREKLSGEFEVALSLASGKGKEHMALIGALINIPVGIRLVVFTKEGVKFVS